MSEAVPGPLVFAWDGEVMRPLSPQAAAQRYTVGKRYTLAPVTDAIDEASRGHYFACLKEAHANLPEDLAARFVKVDHLRKWALVQTGWYHVREMHCDSHEAAERASQLVRSQEPYAVVKAVGDCVMILTARSQSEQAMGGKDFKQSKWDVLGHVAHIIGVSVERLSRNAGQAA